MKTHETELPAHPPDTCPEVACDIAGRDSREGAPAGTGPPEGAKPADERRFDLLDAFYHWVISRR